MLGIKLDSDHTIGSLEKNTKESKSPDEEIEEDVQTADTSYLESGDIRAHFVIDEGSLAEELILNKYEHALNYNGYNVQDEAKKLIVHEKNKLLPEPLNEEEIMAVLIYTSVAVGMYKTGKFFKRNILQYSIYIYLYYTSNK